MERRDTRGPTSRVTLTPALVTPICSVGPSGTVIKDKMSFRSPRFKEALRPVKIPRIIGQVDEVLAVQS